MDIFSNSIKDTNMAPSSDEEEDNPEQLLNEWLGELDILTAGLETITAPGDTSSQLLRPLSHEIAAPRIDSYRFSMANLEDSQDVDLDAILGELCALETRCDEDTARAILASTPVNTRRVSQTVSVESRSVASSGIGRTHSRNCSDVTSVPSLHPHRTDSPDNDSAFSDTVSMLSSESSASSGASAGNKNRALQLNLHPLKDASSQLKAEKIRLALEKMKEASVKKLFIKAFSVDGSSKSLLVDEKMTCGYVARLLADKNHVTMEPKWALVEHLTDLYMERVYEDHEFLVENLMLWTRDSKNKIFFMERADKISLFQTPEKYLICDNEKGSQNEQDEHCRTVLIDEFFSQSINMQPTITHSLATAPNYSGNAVPPLEGPLYLKSESKKGWKKYHFVMRSSGLYYYPKDKSKTLKELVCLTTFDVNDIYLGLNWKKKYKAPSDYCFAIKHPRLQQPKSVKFIKFLCAEDKETLEKWIIAMRIAKHGRQLLDNYRSLVDDLAQEDLDHLAEARSCSVASIMQNTGLLTPQQPLNSPDSISKNQPIYSGGSVAGSSDISSGRHSCVSSSSSSGCMSDGPSESEGNAFDSEFPMGTIKRKPSMKPNLPLTSMTRQLKEMVDLATSSSHHSINSNSDHSSCGSLNSSGYTNSGTLTRRHSRRKSNQASITSDDGNNSRTLKKHNILQRGSIESMSSSRNSNSACSSQTMPKSESIFDTQINGKTTACVESTNLDTLKQNTYSVNLNKPGYYKSNKGDILPSTGILLGYITNGNSGQDVLDNMTWPAKENANIINNMNTTSLIDREKHLPNNYQFSISSEDLSDMPLPPPPQALQYDNNIDQIRNKSSALDPMFCSTFSLDSLPPPPPPILDSSLEGYDITGSQLSLMSLPPPPADVFPMDLNPPKYVPQNADNNFKNEVARVSVSEIVNQLSSSLSQQLNVQKDASNGMNQIYQSIPQQITQKIPELLTRKHSVNSLSLTNNQVNNTFGETEGHQSKYSHNSLNSGIYASCLAEMQLKSSSQVTSPILLRKISSNVDGTKSLSHCVKSVSFDENTNTHYGEPESPVMLRKPGTSADYNTISVVPCSPNKKNKKITFSLPAQGDVPSSPPNLPVKPPPPRRLDTTRLSTSPKKLSDSTSNPPKDFLKDLQRVMKKKWQVAQKCKLEPTTTPHEVLGFREYPVLTEDYKEANVSNWVQEHYGHTGLVIPADNVYENINKTQEDNVVEYATSSQVLSNVDSASPINTSLQRGADHRISVSKKRPPPPPPPKRSESTQLTTLPVQKLR